MVIDHDHDPVEIVYLLIHEKWPIGIKRGDYMGYPSWSVYLLQVSESAWRTSVGHSLTGNIVGQSVYSQRLLKILFVQIWNLTIQTVPTTATSVVDLQYSNFALCKWTIPSYNPSPNDSFWSHGHVTQVTWLTFIVPVFHWGRPKFWSIWDQT